MARTADLAMAQAGSAQREPTMEEILASIRRIIEDSDLARKPDEGIDGVRPDNDSAPTAATLKAPGGVGAPTEPARIIEVDAFRAELRSDSTIAESRKPVTLADVQAQVTAEREAAGAKVEHHRADRPVSERPSESREIPDGEDIAPSALATEAAALRADAWRLGVAAPIFDQAAIDALDSGALDLELSDFTEMVEDAQPSQAHSNLDEATYQATRPALISDQAGKKVAASFGELSEAFAARSRKNLDEMAEEMLRPMLQDWLDNNLPLMVERLVREEIERVARG